MTLSPDDGTERRRRDDALIVRIDERTQAIVEDLKLLKASIVTRAEFAPVKLLVYGLVGLIMTSVIVALLAQVIIQGQQ